MRKGFLASEEARTNAVWATFFVGLVLRLWLTREHPLASFIASDMWVYDMRAGHLVDRPATPWDTFTPVGYPAFLALVYRAFGKAYELIGAIGVVLGGATAALTSLVARRVTGAPRLSLLSGALVAIHPALILYSGFLLTETPSAFLLVLLVWLVLRAADDATWGRLALAGVVLSIGIAVRPNFLLTLPAIVWFAWVRFARDRARTLDFLRRLVACALPVLILVCAHNTRIRGRLTGLATNGGLNFYLAHARVSGVAFQEGSYTHRIIPIPNMIRHEARGPFVSPVPFYDEAFFYRRGLAELLARPGEIVASLDNVVEGVGLGKQGFWPGWKPLDASLALFAKTFAALAIVPALVWGAVLARRGALSRVDGAGRALLFGLVLSALFTLYVFLGDPRVRVPFDPLFLVLAVEAWSRVLPRGPIRDTGDARA